MSNNADNDTASGQASMTTDRLNLHAKLYALADKYDMPFLGDLSLEKFVMDAKALSWDDHAFCKAVSTIYNWSQPQSRLAQAVVFLLHAKAPGGGNSRVLDDHICSIPELAVALWRHGNEVKEKEKGNEDGLGKGPRCNNCGTVEIRMCSGYPVYTNFPLVHTARSNKCAKHLASCRCFPTATSCKECLVAKEALRKTTRA